MNSSDTLCARVSLHSGFLVVAILILLVTAVSALLNAFVFYLLTRSHFFHSNVRLLLKNFTFAATLFSLSMLARNCYHFYLWKYGLSNMSPFTCGLSEIPWDVSAGTATHSISFIGFERVMTTIWKKKYEDTGRPGILAKLMAVGSWMGGTSAGCFLAFTALHENRTFCFCHAALALPIFAQLIIAPAYSVMELTTVACFLFLYRHSRSVYLNFNLETKEHSLSQRHQLMTNMETTLLLAPIMLIHGIAYILALVAFTYIRIQVDDVSSSIDGAMIVTLFMAVESVIHPILLLANHKKLRSTAIHVLPFLKCIVNGQVDPGLNDMKDGALAIAKARASGKNVISTGVVEFRVKPEDNNCILNSMWEQKPKNRDLEVIT